ncbi:MAG: hypothetical protein ACFFKA_00695 [Candidatus Thorarchaeota archaeon]
MKTQYYYCEFIGDVMIDIAIFKKYDKDIHFLYRYTINNRKENTPKIDRTYNPIKFDTFKMWLSPSPQLTTKQRVVVLKERHIKEYMFLASL